MSGGLEVDALVVGATLLGQRVEAVEDHVARLGLRSHQLQEGAQAGALPLGDRTPSLDAVVTRDLGARRQGAKLVQERRAGRSTSPPTSRRYSAKPLAASAWYSGSVGLVEPLAGKAGERSASVNSRARARRDVKRRCTVRVSPSARSRIPATEGLLESASQPASSETPKLERGGPEPAPANRGSSWPPSASMRYQPVSIERTLFTSPVTPTMKRWPSTNPTKAKQAMK